jgi:hypothetical protein
LRPSGDPNLKGVEYGAKFWVAVRTRGIYRNPNGIAGCSPAILKPVGCFVRQEPNVPSGGQGANIEIGAFLIAAGNELEKQELLPLIGTLV